LAAVASLAVEETEAVRRVHERKAANYDQGARPPVVKSESGSRVPAGFTAVLPDEELAGVRQLDRVRVIRKERPDMTEHLVAAVGRVVWR
jgi:hypothetical protein